MLDGSSAFSVGRLRGRVVAALRSYGFGASVATRETATEPSRPRATATASIFSPFAKRPGSRNAS